MTMVQYLNYYLLPCKKYDHYSKITHTQKNNNNKSLTVLLLLRKILLLI